MIDTDSRCEEAHGSCIVMGTGTVSEHTVTCDILRCLKDDIESLGLCTIDDVMMSSSLVHRCDPIYYSIEQHFWYLYIICRLEHQQNFVQAQQQPLPAHFHSKTETPAHQSSDRLTLHHDVSTIYRSVAYHFQRYDR